MSESKTILVTGATSGIGLATARALAKEGATVIISGRSPDRCTAAAAEASAAGWIAADFADLVQVAALADTFKRRYGRLHVLVNNTGAVFQRRRVTREGLEMTFVVNHLAPFLLTTRLVDRLKASAPARVVNLTSVAHAMETLDFDDLQLANGYRPFRAYGRTKLANVMFTYELARRLEGTGVSVNAVHPGLVRTSIGTKGGTLTRVGWAITRLRYRSVLLQPEQAAQQVVRVACSAEMEGITGRYFDGEVEVDSSVQSRDPAACERLWALSEELVRGVSRDGTTSG